MALLTTSGWAQTQSFTATYTGQGAFASTCNSTMNIIGEEPTTGTHPVFLWMVGTFEPSIDDAPSLAAVSGMAARGFVAASIQYDNSFFGTCGQIGGKARCIFDATSAASAVSQLCGRPTADCTKGIVVGGLSQGSILVDLSENYDARVRAGWGMGDGTTYSIYNLSSCVTPANRALPMDRLRVVNGENDNYLAGSDHSRTQSAAVTGYNCGPTAWDCLQADGSGYYIVQSSQVQDGDADHCYWGDGGCLASISTLDPGWQGGTDPWELNANLDWLAGFGGYCGDGIVQPALDEQCDLGPSNGAAGSCCTASCTFVSSGTLCRSAAGECDLAESCTGTSATCPADAKKASGTACTADGNLCTLDQCDGTNNSCQHPAGNAGAICRAQTGVCDVAEACTGTSVTCPPDAFVPATTVCRVSAGACDVAEVCTGTSAACPSDTFASSAVQCRSPAGECDLAESCTGTSATCPADTKKANGTACTDDGNPCTTDTCNGTSNGCQHPAGNAGVECRTTAGVCDVAETCTGTSTACPPDAKSTAVCRASVGPCDAAESCNAVGNDCPADAFASSSTVCRPSAGECDVADACTGSDPSCPADTKRSSGFACTADENPCTLDQCDGTSDACQHPAGNAGVTCRTSARACDVAETCDGIRDDCPPDSTAANGTPCDDGNSCTTSDSCQGGVCTGTPDTSCTDHFLCYKVKPTASFTGVADVHLVDQFEDIHVAVRKVKNLCAPADKNAEGVTDAVTHLASYAIKPLSGTPSFARRTGVRIGNQFGTLFVDVYKRDLLLVPAKKSLGGPTTPPDNDSINVDHYKCYKVKTTAGQPRFTPTTVNVGDQFTSPAKAITLQKIKHLCTPVDKNGEGIKNATAHLACYQAKPANGAPKHARRTGVNTADQFGTLVVGTIKESELCVPSIETFP